MCADNLLAANLEPDDVRILQELESQNLDDEDIKKWAEWTTLSGPPFQGHIVGEEAIDLKTGGSIRVKDPSPVNESVPDTEGLHRFEKEVMIGTVESLLLIQENEGRLHIQVPNHIDSVVNSPAIHRGLGVVDD